MSLVHVAKHPHHLLNCYSILCVLVIIEQKEDKHSNGGDLDLFVLSVFAHHYDRFSKSVAHIELSFVLMLLVVKYLEVLHLGVDFWWQLHVNRHVMWPVHALKRIQGQLKLLCLALVLVDKFMVFLLLLLYKTKVLKHTLQEVHLLHSTL